MSRLGRGLSLTLAAVTAVALAGCGGRSARTYPVKGKLVFKDGKPVGGATLLFQSLADPEKKASADVEADGSFFLDPAEGGGLVEGEHRVAVRPPRSEGAGGVPSKYHSFDTSKLTCTVKPGDDNTCKLEIDRAR